MRRKFIFLYHCHTQGALISACNLPSSPQTVLFSVVLLAVFSLGAVEKHFQGMSPSEAGDKLRNVVTKCSWSRLDFGTRVVKGLEGRPWDGARYAKNAQLKPIHRTFKKILPLQPSYEAALQREAAGRSQIDF